MATQLKVNGQNVSVDAPPDTPLLWVLRDEIGLKGTKFGCGVAFCGACTIHLDGVATRSCVLPVDAVGEAEITTIEGASGDTAEAVRTAWRELDVVQCGYCQSGQMMSAVGLLSEVPKPTDLDIDNAMSGNACRCATYVRIRAAIHRASEIMEA
ncbi:MAG: (2Fe-2S)-binding protein [Pseudomonadota bacterium]